MLDLQTDMTVHVTVPHQTQSHLSSWCGKYYMNCHINL